MQSRISNSLRIAAVVVASAVVAGPLWTQEESSSHYKVTDLGTLKNGTYSQGYFLNREGWIGGTASLADGTQHAVLWHGRIMKDLGTLGGSNSSAFGSPNDRGQVVGEAQTSTPDPNAEDFCGFAAFGDPSYGTCRAFLWQDNAMLALPGLGDDDDQRNSAANWINIGGVVVGTAETVAIDATCPGPTISPQVMEFKPVLWWKNPFGKGYRIQQLPTFSGDPDGVAFAINDKGQVVGATGTCTQFNAGSDQTYLLGLHAVLWDRGGIIDLGNLGGTGPGSGNVANAINNRGLVVGSSYLSGGTTFHGFLWSEENKMQDLGTVKGDTYSAGLGINNAGDVVGISIDASFNARAYIRTHGTDVLVDLNTLIPANSPLYLLQACAINARGQVIGLGVEKNTGQLHGYLLTTDE